MTTSPPALHRWLQSYPALDLREIEPGWLQLLCSAELLPDLAARLVRDWQAEFATLLVEENPEQSPPLSVHYLFYRPQSQGILELKLLAEHGAEIPAISDTVHAADWHEREAWDLYGLRFVGHPFLGDFVLHDEDWPEGLAPMLHAFSGAERPAVHGLGADWSPGKRLEEEGSIVFPIGPIWGDFNESGLWMLETPGEQIRYLHTRLFYKYRAVEKIAEGQSIDHALLLTERFAGAAAFAHSWAFCQAVERIAGCTPPARGQELRLIFAEIERARHHLANIAEIAGSTALSVAKALAQDILEDWLRLSAELCGHRYLFGLQCPGGLRQDIDEARLERLVEVLPRLLQRMQELQTQLEDSSSFLDRIEEMGTLRPEMAKEFGVVGPIARASGREIDLRRHLPYGLYRDRQITIPVEEEGDGFARLRIFFAESFVSIRLIQAGLAHLSPGPVACPCPVLAGHALAWVEAPSGATFHWLRCDAQGQVQRLRLGTPGFRNWHAFEQAMEGAAFQDFPIILATWGLSVAENDR